MAFRWPEHDTFTAYFPDKTTIIDVVDLVLKEIRKHQPTAQVRFSESRSIVVCHLEVWVDGVEQLVEAMEFSFFDDPYSKPGEISGLKRCEGKLTDASRAGLMAALIFFGGKLLARGPRGVNETDQRFPITGNTHQLTPFFRGMLDISEFMPLHGACEVMKSAEIPDERSRLIAIIEGYPSLAS